MSGPFTVCTVRSTVSEAHQLAFPDPPARQLWFVEPTDAAVVLGSTQGIGALDLRAVAARGLSVVRRRSGGGAVVVEPGVLTWFDVLLPAGDARWHDDVGESAAWVGETVAEALRAVGVDASGPARTAVRSPWSSLVCFAVGAGGIVAFLLAERRIGDDALLPLRFFRQGVFGWGTVAGFVTGMRMFGAIALLPLYLQIVQGSSPTQAGLQTLPLMLGMTVFRKLLREMGKPRYLTMVVMLLIMIALPVKMVLRWTFNLQYFVNIQELFLNI